VVLNVESSSLKSFKIKNKTILEQCNTLIRLYESKLSKYHLEINDYFIDYLVKILRQKEEDKDISFTDFFEIWKKEHSNIKGMKNYISAMNAFSLFMQKDNILCKEITVNCLKAFELKNNDHVRAKSLYASSIVRIFNDAREYYNDEDTGIIKIKQSLSKYKIPQQNTAQKRALKIEDIRKIFSLKYDDRGSKGYSSRRDLALDCIKLSFCLGGMNSADLYSCTEYDGEYIRYNREKTKDRRKDNAFMEIKVPKQIENLVKKYKGKNTVFNFCERFNSPRFFNKTLNLGLKKIGKETNIDKLEFYAFRHSLATIAVNDLHIDIYLISKLLNHVEGSLHITELYIKKDFDKINKANKKIVNYVFRGIK
jgi:integrase